MSIMQAILEGRIAILRERPARDVRRERAVGLLLPILQDINALGFYVTLNDFPRR